MRINNINLGTCFKGLFIDADARKRIANMPEKEVIRYARAARDLDFTKRWDLYCVDDKFEIRDRKTGTSLMNKLEPCFEDGVAFIKTEGHYFGNDSIANRIDIPFKKVILPRVNKDQIDEIRTFDELDKNIALIQLLETNKKAYHSDFCNEI